MRARLTSAILGSEFPSELKDLQQVLEFERSSRHQLESELTRCKHELEETRTLVQQQAETIDALIAEDISCRESELAERLRATDALRQARTDLEKAQELAHCGSWVRYLDDNVPVFWSKETYRILGFTEAEFNGRPETFFSLVHPDDLPVLNAVREAALRGEAPYSIDLRILRRDGSLRWVHNEAVVERGPTGRPVRLVGTLHDITERKQVEAALRHSELRYRRIVETAYEGIWTIDADSRTTFVNQRMAQMLGYSPEQMVGRSLFDFLDQEMRGKAEKGLQRRREGYSGQYDIRFLRHDGSTLWALLSTTPIQDEAGQYDGALAMVADITDRKHLEEQFRHAQKMEAIGRLAGGIAHDFNNLLSVVLSYSSLLISDLRPGDPMRSDLEEIQTAGQRARNLTRQLLTFSRQQVVRPEILDLNQIITGMDRMLRRLIGEDVELITLAGPNLGRIRADPGQLEQILMNLVVNARDAMPAGGRITIETASVELDRAYAREHLGVTPGPHVMLSVTDSGVGMDKLTRARIFEPFFTTKGMGKGTGLGLSTVFGIVQQCGGIIWVDSEPAKGSIFRIYIPEAQDSLPFSSPRSIPAAALHGSETVLLVEDEDQVRSLARELLQRHGYQVLEARSAGEALLRSEQFSGDIHLLLTDVVMPQMSGRQLANRIGSQRPGMKVLLMSGYTEDVLGEHGALQSGLALLPKPLTPDALSNKVREVLDSEGGPVA